MRGKGQQSQTLISWYFHSLICGLGLGFILAAAYPQGMLLVLMLPLIPSTVLTCYYVKKKIHYSYYDGRRRQHSTVIKKTTMQQMNNVVTRKMVGSKQSSTTIREEEEPTNYPYSYTLPHNLKSCYQRDIHRKEREEGMSSEQRRRLLLLENEWERKMIWHKNKINK